MGRPINSHYIGNVSGAGQQIVGYAWVAGDDRARQSYIIKQRSTDSYNMASIDGKGVGRGGQIYLVNGGVTQAGQGNIKIVPWGAQGAGATATANLGVSGTPFVYVAGTGDTTKDYQPGEKLSLQGGTYTGNQQANVTVSSVKLRTATPNNPGAGGGYAIGDYFIFSGAGYDTNANILVANVDASGNVTAWSFSDPGVYTSNVLPVDPVTANTVVTSGGTGVTWNLGWGIDALTVTNSGDYTTIPANPVALTGSLNGVGATINVTYSVSTVKVTAGGSGYEVPPPVSFSSGGATAHTVLSGDAVASVVVDNGGSGYTAKPTVTIAPQNSVNYARKITNHIVYTFDNKQYLWLTEGNNLPGPGWAHIVTE